jgi:hypothetical protein
VLQWRGYIEGSPILVRTDHESLKYFLMQKDLGWHLARFADDIAHFDVEIIYRPGKHQLVADTLSRRKGLWDVPDSETLTPLFIAPMNPQKLKEKDHSAIFQTFAEYKQHLMLGEEPTTVGNGTYIVKDNTLCKRIKNHWGEDIEVTMLMTQEQAEEEVKRLHQALGHLGTKATLAAMKTRVSIPYTQEIVEKKLQTCDPCQFTQHEPVAMQPLHPIP